MTKETLIFNILREKDKPLTGFAQKLVEAAQKETSK